MKLLSPTAANGLNLTNLLRESRKFLFILRTDKEMQIQVRTMALGIAVCFALYYCITVLVIEPAQKTLVKKQAQVKELRTTSPAAMELALAAAVNTLSAEKKRLEKQLDALAFKEKIIREHWEDMAEEGQFSKVIFTLLPSAPVNMAKALRQASVADSRTVKGFEMHPVLLTGKSNFNDFFAYLRYLESRPEVGKIGNLSIEALPISRYDQKISLNFSLMVSRLSIREDQQ